MITIPTVDELNDTLVRLDRLLTAKHWERAAIVFAFTTDDRNGCRPDLAGNSARFPLSPTEFARLGFAGLRDRETVARYRQAWQSAVDAGDAKEVSPGDAVELPDLPWPPPAADYPIPGDPSWEEHPCMNDRNFRGVVRGVIEVIKNDEPISVEPIDEEPAAPRPLSAKVAAIRELAAKGELNHPERQPNRSPLPRRFVEAVWELRRAVDRVRNLTNDDRFASNRVAISGSCSGELKLMARQLELLIDGLLDAAASDQRPT
jgi:hypothetical protein